MNATVPVYLAGASGLLAGEFLGLMCEHPGLSLAGAYTRSGGQMLAALHPHLAVGGDEATSIPFERLPQDLRAGLESKNHAKVVLQLALPHGRSGP